MPDSKPSVLIGALVLAVILIVSSVALPPGNNLAGVICCLVALVAPMITIWHYTTTHSLTVPAGKGAGLGALTTGLGTLINVVVGLVLQAVGVLPNLGETLAEAREQAIEQSVAQGNSAEDAQAAVDMMSFMFEPAFLYPLTILGAVLVGAIGGAIGAAVFKKGTADYEV